MSHATDTLRSTHLPAKMTIGHPNVADSRVACEPILLSRLTSLATPERTHGYALAHGIDSADARRDVQCVSSATRGPKSR